MSYKNDAEFLVWWAVKEFEGYRYGDDALEQVYFGWCSRTHPWPIRGVRVEGDTVVITVKGGNSAARYLCGQLLEHRP